MPRPSRWQTDGGAHDGGGELRWLLTYADIITLMMAFFIMLYSMSILNLAKFRDVAVSIRSGFGGMVDGQGRSVFGTTGQMSIRPTAIQGDTAGVPYALIRQVDQAVEAQKLQQSVRMYSDHRGLVISLLSDKVVFAPGQADIGSKALPILREIADLIRKVPNEVRVEGHTCDLPVAGGRFESNWELSTSRATNVVRYFIAREQVPAIRLSAAGYADTHPMLANLSEYARSENRRVEIVLIRPREFQPADALAKTILSGPVSR